MKKDVLPVLLLSPWLMPEGRAALSLLEIEKNGKAINYSAVALNWSLVRKTFRHYPKPALDTLMNCCEEDLAEKHAALKEIAFLQKDPESADAFFRKNLIKYWHRQFESLAPYLPLVKWYHKKQQPGKKAFLTAPCSFSKFRPKLSFEVKKENEALRLLFHALLWVHTAATILHPKVLMIHL